MNSTLIEEALKFATQTECIIIERGAVERVAGALQDFFPGVNGLVIADENTYQVAGQTVHQELKRQGLCRHDAYVFPGCPMLAADFDNVLKLEAWLSDHQGIPVAVGAGTINDITRTAAFRLGRPFVSVATAASMDGYASTGAPMVRDGFKKTIPCEAPRVIVADLDVLANAPGNLTAAGYGDLLGKITAGADWIVADVLGIESIDPTSWRLVQSRLREWVAHPEDLRAGNHEAFVGLFEGLTIAGLAMQQYGTSRPASGCEHQLSHLWEMQGREYRGEHAFHGFTVGLGTIASSVFYQHLLARDLAAIDVAAVVQAWPGAQQLETSVRQQITLPKIVERAVEESLVKHISPASLSQRLEVFAARWPELQARLNDQLMSPETLRNNLQSAGCPTQPANFGLSLEDLKASYVQAQLIRSRYTVFDLATETGLFQDLLDEIFAPGGFWGPTDLNESNAQEKTCGKGR